MERKMKKWRRNNTRKYEDGIRKNWGKTATENREIKRNKKTDVNFYKTRDLRNKDMERQKHTNKG